MKKVFKFLIFSIIISFCTISCDTRNKYHNLMYTENKFKPELVQYIYKDPDSKAQGYMFIVWPELNQEYGVSEQKKFLNVLKELSSVHDVSVEITPIYPKESLHIDEIKRRTDIIVEVFLGFGVSMSRISVAKRSNPKGLERGFRIKIKYYVMKVPNCAEIKQKQTQPLEYPLANFGCATAANFGKMIAYPSSLIEYRKTETDDEKAVNAISSK